MFKTKDMPDGWLALRKEDGRFTLLRYSGVNGNGAPIWNEFSGPYKRRISAVRRAEREAGTLQSKGNEAIRERMEASRG